MDLQKLVGMKNEYILNLLKDESKEFRFIETTSRYKNEISQLNEKRVIKIEEKSGIILMYYAKF